MRAKIDANQMEVKEEVKTNQEEMKTNQEMLARMGTKTDTTLKEMKEELIRRLEAKIEAEIKTNNEKCEVIQRTLISWMDVHQARTEAIQEEIMAKMDTRQEGMRASMNAWRKETMACQEVTEACLESKEPTSLEKKECVVVHEEVPKEEATVKTVRALKERYGDGHLALGHCQHLKEQTHSNGGSSKKFAASHREMIRHAIPASHKGLGCQGPDRDSDA
jgi:hypothetical protein